MPNERAALSSQKTQNKQDEVIERERPQQRCADDDGAPHWITVDSASTSTAHLPLQPHPSDYLIMFLCLMTILFCNCVQMLTKTGLYPI